MTRKVCNGRDIIKGFLQSLFQEPLIGVFLNLNEVGHLKDFFLP